MDHDMIYVTIYDRITIFFKENNHLDDCIVNLEYIHTKGHISLAWFQTSESLPTSQICSTI